MLTTNLERLFDWTNFSYANYNQITEMVESCLTSEIEETVNESVVRMDNCLPAKDIPEQKRLLKEKLLLDMVHGP